MRTLPEGFTEMIKTLCGSLSSPLLSSLAGDEPSLAVRVNALKGIKAPAGALTVPWFPSGGFYLGERPVFAAAPAWHQGLYYVQDASSMAMTGIVAYLSEKYFDNRPLRYLDACAAPGGKTIASIEGLPSGSVVLSNEYDRRRATALVENVTKHGYPSVAISTGDASALGSLGAVFDIVAVDAPCSGEGMMRKEPEAINQWSTGLIDSCAATQRTILDGVWDALRPGGILIYSTCTFNRSEDEDNLAYLIEKYGAEDVALPFECSEGIVGDLSGRGLHCCRFLPGLVRGEGLFIAAVRKPCDGEDRLKMNFAECREAAVTEFVRKHIIDSRKYKVMAMGKDEFSIVPEEDAPFFAYLAKKLRLVRCGTPLCTVKGRDVVPAPELAFSTALKRDSFPEVELDRRSALAYLHGDSLSDIGSAIPKGFVLCTYEGEPLGFAKNIGRRANNLYPDAFRLRMSPDTLPDTEIQIIRPPRP